MPQTRPTLLQRIRRDDDRASWDEFYAVYYEFLCRYATKQGVPPHEVPDIVQEVFSKLYRARQRFEYDPQRARFRTWLLRVARNQVIDWRRSRSRRREQCREVPEIEQPPVPAENIDWAAESRIRVLEYALERVRDESR
jgi:RNA polymerase sigma-70 factor (ECF subfamily)